jgi:hypothetical protein
VAAMMRMERVNHIPGNSLSWVCGMLALFTDCPPDVIASRIPDYLKRTVGDLAGRDRELNRATELQE